MEAVGEREGAAEIARWYGLHGNVVAIWKWQVAVNFERVFEASGHRDSSERESELLKKIGELTVERVFTWPEGLDAADDGASPPDRTGWADLSSAPVPSAVTWITPLDVTTDTVRHSRLWSHLMVGGAGVRGALSGGLGAE